MQSAAANYKKKNIQTEFVVIDIDQITLANNCRLMMKNPLALIDMSKYSICDSSSPFANWILESSAAQNRNFSMFLSNSIFWNKNIRAE